MASVWNIKCPVHSEVIKSERMIPISMDGVSSNEPIFYCDKCGNYYIHTDAVLPNSSFDYGSKKVINTVNEPWQDGNNNLEIVCSDIMSLRPYTEPFIPDTCYKDQEELEYIRYGLFRMSGIEKKISGYYCHECHDFYVEEDVYDEIKQSIPDYEKKFKFEKTDSNKEKIHQYTLSTIANKFASLSTENVIENLTSYEKCEEAFSMKYPFSLLHYAIVFRRFDVVSKIFTDLSVGDIDIALHFAGKEYEWITPLVCAKWNLNYIAAYDEKNDTDIYRVLEPYLSEVEHIDEVMEYTDKVDAEGNDVFDIFWNGRQPILDVIYYPKQILASQQLSNNDFSIVMDEVGTGKTVSALYAVRDVLQKSISQDRKARVLIVCPYNKREDWQSDIRRQLGRFAHIVEQGDKGEMYDGNLKRVFFKNTEHLVMIAGQKQGVDKNGSYSALKGTVEIFSESEDWDLAIIDEAHISFDNYSGIRADKIMLLTATPIVVNAKGKRLFEDYVGLIESVLDKPVIADIDPIIKSEPSTNDVYVNWFREDMGQVSAERKIRFVSCKRWADRDDVFYTIKDDKGTLAALQYDQDDDYLYWAATEQYGYGNIHEVKKNGKLERLIELLRENDKSYIIFCEHKYVVDNIFTQIKDVFTDCIVAEKYGKYENQYGLENVQDGQLINTLMQSLRSEKRVIFITTGKTGGTGLNLGEFDGVVHYELPFTSIELEQRFGRVDRIDTQRNTKSRDMVFLLNECKSDENDLEINRMLYYCTTKIDVTCQFMPIRNTVLYYPEFIKRNGKAIHESMECYKKEYVLSEENEQKMKMIRRNIRQFEKRIKDDPMWHQIESFGRNLRLSAVEALSREKRDDISDEYYVVLSEYLEYWKNTKPDRTAYQKMYRMFLESKKNASNWLAIIGLIKVESESDIFVGAENINDGDEQKIMINDSQMVKPPKKPQTIRQQIDEIIKLIDECVFDDDELKSFSSEGIFCYKDGMIYRSKVDQYRAGNAWK